MKEQIIISLYNDNTPLSQKEYEYFSKSVKLFLEDNDLGIINLMPNIIHITFLKKRNHNDKSFLKLGTDKSPVSQAQMDNFRISFPLIKDGGILICDHAVEQIIIDKPDLVVLSTQQTLKPDYLKNDDI